jgi:hypothetical protein
MMQAFLCFVLEDSSLLFSWMHIVFFVINSTDLFLDEVYDTFIFFLSPHDTFHPLLTFPDYIEDGFRETRSI